jgi:hypothetical protein
MGLQRSSWTLGAFTLLFVVMAPACGGDDDSTSEPSEQQRKNAESCQAMQDALKTQGCETAYTTVRCDIYEGVSGDCVPWFQCLKDAVCDIAGQKKCEDVRGSCGNPG